MAEKLLSVFLHDRLAGALRRKGNGNLHFRYADEEVRFAPRFLEQRMLPFVDRVLSAVPDLASTPEHDDPIVQEIVAGIHERAERLRPA